MDIDVFQLPGIVRKRIHYVVLAAIICAVLALGLVLTQKPFYRSTAELLVDISSDSALGADVGGAPNVQQLVGSQLYLIQSRAVLRDVVQRLDLARDPYLAQQGGLLPGVPGANTAEVAAPDDVISALLENLTVERNQDSFVFTITVKHRSAAMAAKIANAVAESYVRVANKDRLDLNLRNTRTITGQAEELRKRVLAARAAVEAFRADNGLLSTGEQGLITDQQLAGLNQQLLTARQQVEQQKTIYDQARQLNVSNVESGAIPETLNSTLLSGLRGRYAEALDRQAELSANLGKAHPQMRAIRSQIGSIRDVIEKELGRIRQLTANTYERARANLASLEQRFDAQTASTKDSGKVRFRLAQLVSEADALDSAYRSFLTRAEELNRQQDLGGGNSRVISEAVPSGKPIQAPKVLVLIAALLFGTAAGAALAVVRELFGSTDRLERDIAAKTGAPILVVLEGRAAANRKTGFKDRMAPLLPAAILPVGHLSAPEAMPRAAGIRRLSEMLQAEFGTARPATIAFLSPDGSGRTGIAAEIAGDLHSLGEAVLLSDGELRRAFRREPRSAWSAKVRTGALGPKRETPQVAHDDQTLERLLHFQRIGSGTLRKITAISSSRVSTAARLETPDFVIVDCSGTPARFVVPAVLKSVDGIVVVSMTGTPDIDALDALMREVDPWCDKLLGNVLVVGDAA